MKTTIKIYNKILSYALAIVALMFLFNPIPTHASTVNRSPSYASSTITTNLTSGLIGYWTFDAQNTTWSATVAGTGSTTDSSGGGHGGSIFGLVRATSTTIGKIGQALKFDGTTTSARVAISGTSTYANLSALTVSAWINVSAGGNGGGAIATTQGNSVNGWKFYTSTNGNLGFTMTYGTTNLVLLTADNSLVFNKWNFVTVTWNGTNLASGVHLYINGVEIVSYATVTDGSGARTSDTSFTLGNVSTGSIREIVGKLDEVRVYNRVLAAKEVTELYKLGIETISRAPLGFTNTDISSGLSVYWPLDSKYLTWSSGGTAGTSTDATGNTNNSSPLKNMTLAGSVVVGKIGGALKFNGTNNYVQGPVGLIGTSDVTVCAWIKQTAFVSSVNAIVASSKFIFFTSNSNNGIGLTSDGSTNALSASNVITNGVWTHVCGTRDSSGTTNLYVNGALSGSANQTSGTPASSAFNNNVGAKGNGVASFYNGTIDDVRVYSRVLSATEISQLDNQNTVTINKTPTGLTNTDLKNGLMLNWSFDGKYTTWNPASTTQGTTTDLSGNNRNGTIVNIRRSSMVAGRIGQAIQIASTSGTQTVTLNAPLITSTTTALSWGGWFYVKNPGQTVIPSAIGVMGQEVFTAVTTGFFLYQTSANRYQCTPGNNLGAISQGFTVLANRWYHIFCVSTGSLISIYINSTLIATSTLTQAITPNNQAFSLSGLPGDGAMNGYADDIRVYNRALSAAEVKEIYNLGK